MPVRCKHCDYDRTGLSFRMRCPECGGRRWYFDRPYDWGRFQRWPGLIAPAGLLVILGAAAAAMIGVIGWALAGIIAAEGVLVAAMGFVNWK